MWRLCYAFSIYNWRHFSQFRHVCLAFLRHMIEKNVFVYQGKSFAKGFWINKRTFRVWEKGNKCFWYLVWFFGWYLCLEDYFSDEISTSLYLLHFEILWYYINNMYGVIHKSTPFEFTSVPSLFFDFLCNHETNSNFVPTTILITFVNL